MFSDKWLKGWKTHEKEIVAGTDPWLACFQLATFTFTHSLSQTCFSPAADEKNDNETSSLIKKLVETQTLYCHQLPPPS